MMELGGVVDGDGAGRDRDFDSGSAVHNIRAE